MMSRIGSVCRGVPGSAATCTMPITALSQPRMEEDGDMKRSLPDTASHAQQREQLHARRGVFQEAAVQLASCGPASGLLHAAITHAEMLALQNDCDALRVQSVVNGVCDLGGELFLHLQSFGECVNHAGDLGQPDHLAVRNIAHMRLADEGNHVM